MLPVAQTEAPQARRRAPPSASASPRPANSTPANDTPPEDNRPIDERLSKIGDHLRKNAVSKNYGHDAGLKVADNIFNKYVESSRMQDGLLKKASEDQKDVLESLSASMLRFRKDEKSDVGKFRKEMLAVLTNVHAADGDEDVKKYVESTITAALRNAEKSNGLDGAIHKFMTKDSEKNKDSWLFKKISGTETVEKQTEIAKNEGIALNEQDKLNDHIHKGAASSETEPHGKLEKLIADLTAAIRDMKFPSKIDVLNVNKLVVNSMERRKAKREADAQSGKTEPKVTQKLLTGPVDSTRMHGKEAYRLGDNGLMMPEPNQMAKKRKTKLHEVEDVEFREVHDKKNVPLIGHKPLAIGHDLPKHDTHDDSPIKPKYQGKLKTNETPMASAVRSAMNVGKPLAIRPKNVTATPLMASKSAAMSSLDNHLSVPTMNKFDAMEDRSDATFVEKQPELANVEPKADDSDPTSGILDVLGSLPGLPGGHKAPRAKKPPVKAKTSGLAKAGRFAKGLLKTAAVADAGMAVYDGVKDIANGGTVDNVSDIVPKGDLMDMLSPGKIAMNAGRYAGGKINSGYEAISKKMGGTGSIGSDLFDKFSGTKPIDLNAPAVKPSTNNAGDQIAKASTQSKEMASTPATPAPVIVHAPASAPVVSSSSPQPAVVSGLPRTRESYFDRQMNRTFVSL